MLTSPGWPPPTCDECRTYMYDFDNGRIKLDQRTRLPMLRPKHAGNPPCGRCPKVPPNAPEKTWEYAADMTPAMQRVLYHYRACRAVNRFENDPIVEACAVLIYEAERQAEQYKDSLSDGRIVSVFNNLTNLMQKRRG